MNFAHFEARAKAQKIYYTILQMYKRNEQIDEEK